MCRTVIQNLSTSACRRIATCLLWSVFLATAPAGLAADVSSTRPGTVSAETLDAKIKEVEATVGMDDAAKTKLVELYSKARTNLELAAANDATAARYETAVATVPAQIQTIRETIGEAQSQPPEETLALALDAPLAQLEPLLQKERVDLAAVDARRADFEKRLEEEANRPGQIRQRLTEARARHEEVAAEMTLQPPAEESPALSEAKRLLLETQSAALSAEIRMLDQELLSQPMRVDLLAAQRDQAINSVEWIGRRVQHLQERVAKGRREEAEQAQAQAQEMRRQAEGEHPVVVNAAEQNARLSERLAGIAAGLEKLSKDQELAEKLVKQIEGDFRSARETIEIAGLSQALGQVLQAQRQSLPDVNTFRRQAKERERQISEVALQRLRHREELKGLLRDLDARIEALALIDTAAGTPGVRETLRGILLDRRQLLEKAIETDELHLRQLGELDVVQRRLLDTAKAYDDFLAEHLLWIRSTTHAQFKELGALPGEAWRFLSPTGWLRVARVLVYQATHSPAFALVLLVLGTLLWKRRWLTDAMRATGREIDKPSTDSFAFTLRALALVLVAAAWPLVLAALGWQLKVSLQGTGFTGAVALACLAIAAQFYLMRAFRIMCLPGGLAAEHFRWPESSLQVLRVQLDRLTWTFLPAGFVSVFAINLDPVTLGGMIGRLSLVVMTAALALFFYRVLHPQRGVLADFLRQRTEWAFGWIHRFWLPLLVVAQLALALLALTGYLYTAAVMIENLLQTAWMVVGLIVLHELALRWLRVTRRRLAYEAAMERREAEQEAREPKRLAEDDELPDVEEPEVDLDALSDEGRKLLNTAIVFTGIVGLAFIWLDVLPALQIFDQISVWHHTVTVDGADKSLPITLADVALGLVFALATVILAKRFPAVLEIILMRRFDMPANSRYTVITLTTYAIVAVGTVLVFDTLGASWSQIQWLVAALSVGIGFGLQEIVANFISGLIILFERPIRVGDLITVGDASGTVVRIRIRATTIRDFEQKELLVPNKELITGRLLNWTLSDETTRILINVGIAYGSDVDRAMEILLALAREDERVLDEPQPRVVFDQFADSSLNLAFRVFVGTLADRLPVITDMHRNIHTRFAEEGIVIAFPQRDLHLDTNGPLHVSIDGVGQTGPGEVNSNSFRETK